MGAYVEVIRNTPFVVQLFFIVFGLPNLGLKMTAGEAALLAMIVNPGAYSTEIVRAGIEVTPKRAVGGWPGTGAQPESDLYSGGFTAGVAAYLPGAGEPVHYRDAWIVGGIAGLL